MPPTLEFKVVIIGSVAVGKTAITNRLQYEHFEEEYQATIGAGYIPYRTTCDGHNIELQIWDTAGMERYKSLGPIYYRDAVACIIVYDQTSPESEEAVPRWLESFRATVKTPAVIAVAANKDDLAEEHPVDNMQYWAKENEYLFFRTSAKSGLNISEMFGAVVRDILKMGNVEATPQKIDTTVPTTEQKKKCC